MEAIDVENDEFRFFGPDGTEYKLRTDRQKVVVTDAVLGHFPDELRDKLREYLTHVPRKRRTLEDAEIAQAPLPTLVEETMRLHKPGLFG
jgi:hypothetical protein